MTKPNACLAPSCAVIRWGICCVLLSLFAATAVAVDPPQKAKLVGSASCAAAACHGGLSGHKVVGSEFPVWSARDPHARAYAALRSKLSERIAERMTLSKQTAHESAECLNCHSPAIDANSISITEYTPQAGVDCERCHGAAEHWLTPHKWKNWKDRSAADKTRLGFADLGDVLTRAKLCTECHVGGPNQDVNHEMIAAGHPRLFFELSTFHANWPKHWPRSIDENKHRVAGAQQGAPESRASLFEAKLWAVGQVVTAQRSLELLSHRASEVCAWPEFAEWNCFSCHHDLQFPSSWQLSRAEKRPSDLFAWNAWPYAMLEPLALQTRGPDLNDPMFPFRRLRSQFTKALPPAEDIAKDAAKVAESLEAWAKRLNYPGSDRVLLSPESLKSLRQELVKKAEAEPLQSGREWDSTTQLFLSISALHYAEKAARDIPVLDDEEHLKGVLKALQESLNFPDEYHSPHRTASTPD